VYNCCFNFFSLPHNCLLPLTLEVEQIRPASTETCVLCRPTHLLLRTKCGQLHRPVFRQVGSSPNKLSLAQSPPVILTGEKLPFSLDSFSAALDKMSRNSYPISHPGLHAVLPLDLPLLRTEENGQFHSRYAFKTAIIPRLSGSLLAPTTTPKACA
jgi:hypothetical protein